MTAQPSEVRPDGYGNDNSYNNGKQLSKIQNKLLWSEDLTNLTMAGRPKMPGEVRNGRFLPIAPVRPNYGAVMKKGHH